MRVFPNTRSCPPARPPLDVPPSSSRRRRRRVQREENNEVRRMALCFFRRDEQICYIYPSDESLQYNLPSCAARNIYSRTISTFPSDGFRRIMPPFSSVTEWEQSPPFSLSYIYSVIVFTTLHTLVVSQLHAQYSICRVIWQLFSNDVMAAYLDTYIQIYISLYNLYYIYILVDPV